MNKKRLNFFKSKLLKDKEKASENMKMIERGVLHISQRDDSGDLSAYSIHMADMGTDTNEKEKTAQIYAQSNKYYNKIDDALKRIENNTYGICEECKNPINEERLKVIPIATLCVSCKEKQTPKK